MLKDLIFMVVGYMTFGSFTLYYVAYGSLVYYLTKHKPDKKALENYSKSLKFPFSIYKEMLKLVGDGVFITRRDFNWWSGILTKYIMAIPYLSVTTSLAARAIDDYFSQHLISMVIYLLLFSIYFFSLVCVWQFGRNINAIKYSL